MIFQKNHIKTTAYILGTSDAIERCKTRATSERRWNEGDGAPRNGVGRSESELIYTSGIQPYPN
jgi:hypothetical protein